MGINTVPHPPYSPDLAPCDFWLFPRLSFWDNWGDERGCDEGDWHAHTRGLPWGLPEVAGTVQQVDCNRRRVFANGPGDLGSIPGRVIPKTLKMVLDTTLLNTQHYKVRFKGKVEQSWEWSSAPLHLGVVAIEKGAFGSPSTMLANFTLLTINKSAHTKKVLKLIVCPFYIRMYIKFLRIYKIVIIEYFDQVTASPVGLNCRKP